MYSYSNKYFHFSAFKRAKKSVLLLIIIDRFNELAKSNFIFPLVFIQKNAFSYIDLIFTLLFAKSVRAAHKFANESFCYLQLVKERKKFSLSLSREMAII